MAASIRYCFLTLVFFISVQSFAQPNKVYEREKANREYTQKVIDGARINTNTPLKNLPGTGRNIAAEQLAESWFPKTPKEDPSVKKAKEEAEKAKYQELKRKGAIEQKRNNFLFAISGHGNAKTEADYNDLRATGERNGNDANTITNVIGANIDEYHQKFGNNPNVPYKSQMQSVIGRQLSLVENEESEKKSIAYENQKLKEFEAAEEANDRSACIKLSEEILKLRPSWETCSRLASFYTKDHNWTEALKVFEQGNAESKHWKGQNSSMIFALCYAMLGDMANAQKIFEAQNKVVENYGAAQMPLVWTLIAQGKIKEADDMLRRMTINGTDGFTYVVRAAITPGGSKRDDLLKEAVSKSKSLSSKENRLKNGTLGELLIQCAEIEIKNKKPERALIYLDLAVSNYPGNAEYVKLQQDIGSILGRKGSITYQKSEGTIDKISSTINQSDTDKRVENTKSVGSNKGNFSYREPVKLKDLLNTSYPDMDIKKDKEPYPALVGSGILTKENFEIAYKNSLLEARPQAFKELKMNNELDGPTWLKAEDYNAYKIGQWTWKDPTNSNNTMDFALVWIPSDKNKHMPLNMRPAGPYGFFMVINPWSLVKGN